MWVAVGWAVGVSVALDLAVCVELGEEVGEGVDVGGRITVGNTAAGASASQEAAARSCSALLCRSPLASIRSCPLRYSAATDTSKNAATSHPRCLSGRAADSRPQEGQIIRRSGCRRPQWRQRTIFGRRRWRAPHAGQIVSPLSSSTPQRLHSIKPTSARSRSPHKPSRDQSGTGTPRTIS